MKQQGEHHRGTRLQNSQVRLARSVHLECAPPAAVPIPPPPAIRRAALQASARMNSGAEGRATELPLRNTAAQRDLTQAIGLEHWRRANCKLQHAGTRFKQRPFAKEHQERLVSGNCRQNWRVTGPAQGTEGAYRRRRARGGAPVASARPAPAAGSPAAAARPPCRWPRRSPRPGTRCRT